MAKLTPTKQPGIFRRHRSGCNGRGRCECNYVVVWRHRGRQHTETYRTYVEATEAQGQRKAGNRRPTSKIGFGAYFDDWIETYEGRTTRGFTDTSRDLYRRAISDHALPEWRSWKLAEVEPAEVKTLFSRLRREGRSRATLKILRSALSAMYATAAEEGAVMSNPIRGVRIPNGESEADKEKRAKALNREELDLLLAAVPDDWRLFFEFLTVTGLRIGEAVGLRWEHLDLGPAPIVKVREQVYRGKRKRLKSREGRRDIPLTAPMAAKMLAHRRDSYVGPTSPVFATAIGTELDPHNVRNTVLRPVALELGHYEEVVGDDGEMRKKTTIGFHAFRHTCASLLFAEGRNVKQVQRWLGHAKASITLDTYLHLLDEGVGEGLEIGARVNTGSTGGLQTDVDDEPVGSPELAC
jgi:integrase